MAAASSKVRLTVSVSRATNREVRALLGARRIRRGELSKFVEQAMQVQMFRLMIDDIKERNANLDAATLQVQVDRAVREVRSERRKVSGAAREAALV